MFAVKRPGINTRPRQRSSTVQLGWDTFKSTKKDTRKSLLAGGADPRRVAKFFVLQEKRFRKLLSDDDRIRNDATFSGSALYIVTGARKRIAEES